MIFEKTTHKAPTRCYGNLDCESMEYDPQTIPK